MKRVLVTGGAGFIGSHLVDLLLAEGIEVVVLDNLDPQVHPGFDWPKYMRHPGFDWPKYMRRNRPGLVLIPGDVRRSGDVKEAIRGCDAVAHLAAKVGVGQGQYAIADYYSNNVQGTANLLEQIAAIPKADRPRLFVAGSMSAYGEGPYMDHTGAVIRGAVRSKADLEIGRWDLQWCARCEPARESDPLQPAGFYAETKAEQERMALIFGRTYDVPVHVGRFFNTYGTRQALGNPYTGVIAIFANQLLSGEQPTIYEDGRQCRDFINVVDVASAVLAMLKAPPETAGVYNVSTCVQTSILTVATMLATVLEIDRKPLITGKFRSGDIRHCIGDNSRLRDVIGWKAKTSLETGMEVMVDWLLEQRAASGLQAHAHKQMTDRDLA